jgi:hypothetical protein
LEVQPFRLGLERLVEFGDGLRVQATFEVGVCQRAGRHLNFAGAFVAAFFVEAVDLVVDGGDAGFLLKGALHVPDCLVDLVLRLVDGAYAQVGDEIVRLGAEYAPEHVAGVLVSLLLQQGFAEHAVGVEVLGEPGKDVFAVPDEFIQGLVLKQDVQFPEIIAKVQCFCHSNGSLF